MKSMLRRFRRNEFDTSGSWREIRFNERSIASMRSRITSLTGTDDVSTSGILNGPSEPMKLLSLLCPEVEVMASTNCLLKLSIVGCLRSRGYSMYLLGPVSNG